MTSFHWRIDVWREGEGLAVADDGNFYLCAARVCASVERLERLPTNRSLNECPYLEPHHVRRLSDGGPDHPDYVVALCPSFNRRVHHGVDGDVFNTDQKAKIGASAQKATLAP